MEPLTWHTEQRKISDLVPFEHNPRRLTELQAKQLQVSLEKFNLVEIPAINTDNVILAGHQRLKIMQLLGRGEEMTDVRVPNRLLTPEEVKEYVVRSNKNTGEWDFDILANTFDPEALQDWGFSKGELGLVPSGGAKAIDRDNMAAGLENYMNAEIRQIVLFYKGDQHTDMCKRLDAAMKELGTSNWSETVAKLLEHYEIGDAPQGHENTGAAQ